MVERGLDLPSQPDVDVTGKTDGSAQVGRQLPERRARPLTSEYRGIDPRAITRNRSSNSSISERARRALRELAGPGPRIVEVGLRRDACIRGTRPVARPWHGTARPPAVVAPPHGPGPAAVARPEAPRRAVDLPHALGEFGVQRDRRSSSAAPLATSCISTGRRS